MLSDNDSIPLFRFREDDGKQQHLDDAFLFNEIPGKETRPNSLIVSSEFLIRFCASSSDFNQRMTHILFEDERCIL